MDETVVVFVSFDVRLLEVIADFELRDDCDGSPREKMLIPANTTKRSDKAAMTLTIAQRVPLLAGPFADVLTGVGVVPIGLKLGLWEGVAGRCRTIG